MAKWAIEYYDEGTEDFIEFTGYNLNQVYEELGETGAEGNVLKQLRILGVMDAYILYGVYDLLVKVSAETMAVLKEAITFKIRTISQVRSTLTLIVSDDYKHPQNREIKF